MTDHQRLLRWAEEQGFTKRRTKNGHWRLDPPPCCADRSPVFAASTPSDRRRGTLNTRAEILRRLRTAA